MRYFFSNLVSVFALTVACTGDGGGAKDAAGDTAQPGNQAPTTPLIALGPSSPTTLDDLVVSIITPSQDPDGDEVTYTFQWLQDSILRDDLEGDTLSALETSKDEGWTVIVTAGDGALLSEPAQGMVTIANSAPDVEVAFSTNAPTTLDDLEALATATDIDGDELILTWTWTVDGASTNFTNSTISAAETSKNEQWLVSVSASDNALDSLPASAVTLVGNSPPSMDSLEVVPSEIYEATVVAAVPTALDDDGDTVGFLYEWAVNGIVIAETSSTLDGASFNKHDTLEVTVTPDDGEIIGVSMTSGTVTILNTIPSITGVEIDPQTVYEATTLTCGTSGFSDEDGDPEGTNWEWMVNGAVVSTVATLDGAFFNRSDVVSCTGTPWDGEELGATHTSASVTVFNTPPVLSTVTLSTTSPQEADTVTATLAGAADDDGDAIVFDYTWLVDGVAVSTLDNLTGDFFNKGQQIHVEVTPSDGTDSGVAVFSDIALAVNSAPQVTSVSLSPGAVYADTTLSAVVTAEDPDGDAVVLDYQWLINGASQGGGGASSFVGNGLLARGDSVSVVVIPSDADGAVGNPMTSVEVVVLNSAPAAPVIGLSPSDPRAGLDDLVCEVVSPSTDIDGDLVTYSFSWEEEGAAYNGAVETSTTSTISQAVTTLEGALWTCTVEPDDGFEVGPISTASVTVGCGEVTESWVQDGGRPQDILFALDWSCSMNDDIANIQSNFSAFLADLTATDTDYHLAVVVRDGGCIRGNDTVIDSNTANAQNVFDTMVGNSSDQGYDTESLFSMLEDALGKVEPGDCNEGFYREDAQLNLVTISDETEQSYQDYPYFVSLFQSLKSDPADLFMHAVSADNPANGSGNSCGADYGSGSLAGRYENATIETGGLYLSICATDYMTGLAAAISAKGAPPGSFEVSAEPDTSTITVAVDGFGLSSGWSYSSGNGSVVFDTAPSNGATIEISYIPTDCGI